MLEVYYATNRRILAEGKTPKFGDRFNEEGPQELRFGSAKVQKVKGKYALKKVVLMPERKDKDLPSGVIFEDLRKAMADKRLDVICLIHGFASTVETALERAAEIKDKYKVGGREAEVFVFSWPSDGAVFPPTNYFEDRADAQASGIAMARAFFKLRAFLDALDPKQQCKQSLHLVAHSMGNYALRWAFQAIRVELGGRIPRFFDNIFLMAADEDDDALHSAEKLALLPNLARNVHVYFSPDDRALVVSDITKGNPDRLGSHGPAVRDGLRNNVVLVDCRHVDVSDDDISNHQYYRLNEKVVDDVKQVLAGKHPDEIQGRSISPDRRSWRIDVGPGDPVAERERQTGRHEDRGN